MRVRIDPVKCEGFGKCAEILPPFFLLDEWGYAYVTEDGLVPDGMDDAAREAVINCPVNAIVILEP